MKRAERIAMTPYPPALMNAVQAAVYVSRGVSTIDDLRKRGKFPARVKVGEDWLYRRADLDLWVASLPTEEEVGACEMNVEATADEALLDEVYGCSSAT